MATLFSIAASLALVLFLLGLAMRALRRFATGVVSGKGRLPLEVMQRVALGPKQGIAIVRIGERVIAVSMGEGGVRQLAVIEDADREALLTPSTVPAKPLPIARSFQAALKAAMRTAAVLLVLLTPAVLHAQAPALRPPVPATQQALTAESVDQIAPRIAPQIDLKVGDPAQGGLRLSGTVGIVIMMGLLTLLPTLILMMTSFTRILIVLHFLRQALGTQNAPPAHLIAGLALLLSGFVMAPTLNEVNTTALKPWLSGQMQQGEMLVTAVKPFRKFMLAQTRQSDIRSFMSMSRTPAVQSVDQIPLVVVMSAFVTSELKTAFQIGFALFLPFIIIDVVVASVLMSMGMFMLPPAMISLPFKLLLFVLVDGWTLIVQGLVSSFH